jgi:quinoprotein glucose dehydrogenase
MLRELQNIILLQGWRKPTGGAEWSVGILGGVIALIGIILALGGAKLLGVGGSWYYLFAGLALIVAGLAIAQRKLLGAWIYAGAFVVTALWAFWEVGLNGWALVPRLVGPLVLLLLVILSLPVLDPNRGRRRRLFGLGGFALIVIVLGVAVAQANRPDAPGAMPEPFAQAMADASLMQVGADWPAYGGTYNAQRYSPLDQINRNNVRGLERAWTFRTGDMPKERWGAETTPLKIGDTLYLCTGRSTLIAIDAATGAERWRHDPEVPDASIPYTAACRGVAYYAAPNADPAGACATRIIAGTLDARLIAVDARTGTPCADFGKNGAVDITIGMGETGPGMVSITSAPTIVRGVVITGQQVLDGQRANAPSGVVQGFDAITGALRWAWDMEHPERTGRPPEGETYARGTPNMWTTATGDEALGLVYLPLGNAAADYWSSHRSQAENEHSAALVALNVETGREVWRFQTVHMGVWDYDLGSQPTLIDFPTEAGVVPAVVLPSKQGEIYILNRRTGVPLHGVEERPVPGGGLEPELRSRCRFMSTRPRSEIRKVA